MDTPSAEPKTKPPKPPRTSKLAVMRNGVWEPFRLLKLKTKPSALRNEFTEVSVALEEMQDEYERVERALTFLRGQVVDMEVKLAGLDTAKTKAAKYAADLLAQMTAKAA